MSKTSIEWATDVWNPVTGCQKVSEGCRNCYAKALHDMRHAAYKRGASLPKQYAVPFETVTLHPERLEMPLHWRKPRRIFVNSMSDLFHEDVPDEFIWRVFDTMTRGNRRHTYMVLTKRPARMKAWFESNQKRFWHYHAPGEPQREYVSAPWPDPCIWLGVSVENQQAAIERIPLLLQTPAAVRFVSCEPLLGPVDLRRWMYPCGGHGATADNQPTVSWVIVGGESGPGARPMHPDWVRSLRDQCQGAKTAFFFKQWGMFHYDPLNSKEEGRVYMDATGKVYSDRGSYEDYKRGRLAFDYVGKKAAGRLLDGKEWNEYPQQL